MSNMNDETKIMTMSIGNRLIGEFDAWVAATNEGADIDTRMNRSSAIRRAMRQMMADNPANGHGE